MGKSQNDCRVSVAKNCPAMPSWQAVTDMWQRTSSRISQSACTLLLELRVRRANQWASMDVCERKRGGRHTLTQFQFLPCEKIILFFDLFRKILPFCRFRRRFQETPHPQHWSFPEPSRRKKHAGVWLVFGSPLSQRQCPAQETRCL